MRTVRLSVMLATLIAASFAMASCGSAMTSEASATTDASPTTEASPPDIAGTDSGTSLIEIRPYSDNGDTAEGWVIDDSTLTGDYAVDPQSCRPSEHGAGNNTIACGSTADGLSACWLTETRDEIACLDEYDPQTRDVRLIQLDGPTASTTEATEDPVPLWLELTDGTMFRAVNGGAFSPPEGFLVAYVRVSGDSQFDEILVSAADGSATIDKTSDMWSVTVGADGSDVTAARTVSRAWVLAGRDLPEPSPSEELTLDAPEGRWCPTESTAARSHTGCVTIAYPKVTYDIGVTEGVEATMQDDGTILLIVPGAPLGFYAPAGTPLPAEALMGEPDDVNRERIWSGQTGVMLVRE